MEYPIVDADYERAESSILVNAARIAELAADPQRIDDALGDFIFKDNIPSRTELWHRALLEVYRGNGLPMSILIRMALNAYAESERTDQQRLR